MTYMKSSEVIDADKALINFVLGKDMVLWWYVWKCCITVIQHSWSLVIPTQDTRPSLFWCGESLVAWAEPHGIYMYITGSMKVSDNQYYRESFFKSYQSLSDLELAWCKWLCRCHGNSNSWIIYDNHVCSSPNLTCSLLAWKRDNQCFVSLYLLPPNDDNLEVGRYH